MTSPIVNLFCKGGLQQQNIKSVKQIKQHNTFLWGEILVLLSHLCHYLLRLTLVAAWPCVQSGIGDGDANSSRPGISHPADSVKSHTNIQHGERLISKLLKLNYGHQQVPMKSGVVTLISAVI